MWILKPLQGKYYGTIVSNTETGDRIEVWLSMQGNYKPSEREIDNGWVEEYGYDHVEIQSSYEAAKKIVKALNDETNCTGHRDEHGSRYDPFVRNSGH